MTHIVSTAVLNLLVQRRQLAARGQTLGLTDDAIEFLKTLRRKGAVQLTEIPEHLPLEKMAEYRLIAREEILPDNLDRRTRELRRQGRELLHLQAVNFELTYRCDMACGHCLQQNLRNGDLVEMSKDRFVAAIHQAWFAALPLAGINLTGGEPLVADGPVLELIIEAASLGFPMRLNTNSWWGRSEQFCVGGRVFATAEALVAHLRDIGVSLLAFSYDERIQRNHVAGEQLVGAICACERQRMPYQIIFTGLNPDEIEDVLQLAQSAISMRLDYFMPVMMQTVDLGGAAGTLAPSATQQSRSGSGEPDYVSGAACEQDAMFCRGKGYYRPSYLHISPSGAVRSCLYAPQLGNIGDLSRENLLDMVNRFPSDPASRAFQIGDVADWERQLLKLYAELYRPVVHPCAASARIARLIDETHRFAMVHGRPAEGDDLRQIHVRVAREYNLLRT